GFRDGKVVMPTGLVQGQKLLMLLRRLLLPAWDTEDFDHLDIPFRAVAANLGNGQTVILDHGNLALAVRASMSVPGAFAPTRYGDQLLVDGGILDNVPVDVARAMGATRMIVVDVGTPLESERDMTRPKRRSGSASRPRRRCCRSSGVSAKARRAGWPGARHTANATSIRGWSGSSKSRTGTAARRTSSASNWPVMSANRWTSTSSTGKSPRCTAAAVTRCWTGGRSNATANAASSSPPKTNPGARCSASSACN